MVDMLRVTRGGRIVGTIRKSDLTNHGDLLWDGLPRQMSAFDENEPARVNVANLARVGSAAMSAN